MSYCIPCAPPLPVFSPSFLFPCSVLPCPLSGSTSDRHLCGSRSVASRLMVSLALCLSFEYECIVMIIQSCVAKFLFRLCLRCIFNVPPNWVSWRKKHSQPRRTTQAVCLLSIKSLQVSEIGRKWHTRNTSWSNLYTFFQPVLLVLIYPSLNWLLTVCLQ